MYNTEKVLEVIMAGATAIQLREDSYIETSEFAKIAKAIHEVTNRHNIPLVIHDRVDVAVSAGAEGVELGKGCLGELSAEIHLHRAHYFCKGWIRNHEYSCWIGLTIAAARLQNCSSTYRP